MRSLLLKAFEQEIKCIPSSRRITRYCGFTIVETLIVVLIIGIISATGLSLYSGVTQDAQVQSMTDSLQVFFSACRHRARYRGIPVYINVKNKTLLLGGSSALHLSMPELTDEACQQMNGMVMTASQTFNSRRQSVHSILIPVSLPGNKVINLQISL